MDIEISRNNNFNNKGSNRTDRAQEFTTPHYMENMERDASKSAMGPKNSIQDPLLMDAPPNLNFSKTSAEFNSQGVLCIKIETTTQDQKNMPLPKIHIDDHELHGQDRLPVDQMHLRNDRNFVASPKSSNATPSSIISPKLQKQDSHQISGVKEPKIFKSMDIRNQKNVKNQDLRHDFKPAEFNDTYVNAPQLPQIKNIHSKNKNSRVNSKTSLVGKKSLPTSMNNERRSSSVIDQKQNSTKTYDRALADCQYQTQAAGRSQNMYYLLPPEKQYQRVPPIEKTEFACANVPCMYQGMNKVQKKFRKAYHKKMNQHLRYKSTDPQPHVTPQSLKNDFGLLKDENKRIPSGNKIFDLYRKQKYQIEDITVGEQQAMLSSQHASTMDNGIFNKTKNTKTNSQEEPTEIKMKGTTENNSIFSQDRDLQNFNQELLNYSQHVAMNPIIHLKSSWNDSQASRWLSPLMKHTVSQFSHQDIVQSIRKSRDTDNKFRILYKALKDRRDEDFLVHSVPDSILKDELRWKRAEAESEVLLEMVLKKQLEGQMDRMTSYTREGSQQKFMVDLKQLDASFQMHQQNLGTHSSMEQQININQVMDQQKLRLIASNNTTDVENSEKRPFSILGGRNTQMNVESLQLQDDLIFMASNNVQKNQLSNSNEVITMAVEDPSLESEDVVMTKKQLHSNPRLKQMELVSQENIKSSLMAQNKEVQDNNNITQISPNNSSPSQYRSTSINMKNSPNNNLDSSKLEAVYSRPQGMINSINNFNNIQMQQEVLKSQLRSSERISPPTERHFKLPQIMYRSTSKQSSPIRSNRVDRQDPFKEYTPKKYKPTIINLKLHPDRVGTSDQQKGEILSNSENKQQASISPYLNNLSKRLNTQQKQFDNMKPNTRDEHSYGEDFSGTMRPLRPVQQQAQQDNMLNLPRENSLTKGSRSSFDRLRTDIKGMHRDNSIESTDYAILEAPAHPNLFQTQQSKKQSSTKFHSTQYPSPRLNEKQKQMRVSQISSQKQHMEPTLHDKIKVREKDQENAAYIEVNQEQIHIFLKTTSSEVNQKSICETAERRTTQENQKQYTTNFPSTEGNATYTDDKNNSKQYSVIMGETAIIPGSTQTNFQITPMNIKEVSVSSARRTNAFINMIDNTVNYGQRFGVQKSPRMKLQANSKDQLNLSRRARSNPRQFDLDGMTQMQGIFNLEKTKDKKLLEQFLNSRLGISSRQFQVLPASQLNKTKQDNLPPPQHSFALGKQVFKIDSPHNGTHNLANKSADCYVQTSRMLGFSSPIDGQLIEAELKSIQKKKLRNAKELKSQAKKVEFAESKKWKYFGISRQCQEILDKSKKLTPAQKLESQSLPKTYQDQPPQHQGTQRMVIKMLDSFQKQSNNAPSTERSDTETENQFKELIKQLKTPGTNPTPQSKSAQRKGEFLDSHIIHAVLSPMKNNSNDIAISKQPTVKTQNINQADADSTDKTQQSLLDQYPEIDTPVIGKGELNNQQQYLHVSADNDNNTPVITRGGNTNVVPRPFYLKPIERQDNNEQQFVDKRVLYQKVPGEIIQEVESTKMLHDQQQQQRSPVYRAQFLGDGMALNQNQNKANQQQNLQPPSDLYPEGQAQNDLIKDLTDMHQNVKIIRTMHSQSNSPRNTYDTRQQNTTIHKGKSFIVYDHKAGENVKIEVFGGVIRNKEMHNSGIRDDEDNTTQKLSNVGHHVELLRQNKNNYQMSTNTIKQLSNTKENEDLLNLSDFHDHEGSPGRAIEMNLSNAKMTFSKEKIDDDARNSIIAKSSSKKIVSSKLHYQNPMNGSKSNINWKQNENHITEESFIINSRQITQNKQEFQTHRNTPKTGNRRNSAVQADIMITDDDDQSLKEQFTDDLMTPSLVNVKMNDAQKAQKRFRKKKKGTDGLVIVRQKSPPAITPNFISSVQIIQSSNRNYIEKLSRLNQGSCSKEKSKKSKGNKGSPNKPQWNHHPQGPGIYLNPKTIDCPIEPQMQRVLKLNSDNSFSPTKSDEMRERSMTNLNKEKTKEFLSHDDYQSKMAIIVSDYNSSKKQKNSMDKINFTHRKEKEAIQLENKLMDLMSTEQHPLSHNTSQKQISTGHNFYLKPVDLEHGKDTAKATPEEQKMHQPAPSTSSQPSQPRLGAEEMQNGGRLHIYDNQIKRQSHMFSEDYTVINSPVKTVNPNIQSMNIVPQSVSPSLHGGLLSSSQKKFELNMNIQSDKGALMTGRDSINTKQQSPIQERSPVQGRSPVQINKMSKPSQQQFVEITARTQSLNESNIISPQEQMQMNAKQRSFAESQILKKQKRKTRVQKLQFLVKSLDFSALNQQNLPIQGVQIPSNRAAHFINYQPFSKR